MMDIKIYGILVILIFLISTFIFCFNISFISEENSFILLLFNTFMSIFFSLSYEIFILKRNIYPVHIIKIKNKAIEEFLKSIFFCLIIITIFEITKKHK